MVLTINYDLCLLGLRCVYAADVAAVRASVINVDLVDSQDANGLCGMRQSFTIGLCFHPAVGLVRRKCLKISFLIYWFHMCYWHVDTMYQFARVWPLNVHSGVELNQRCAVEGEGLPHYQLNRILRKQLDIVNLTSCTGKRKRGGGESRETVGVRQRGRSRWHCQQFFLPQRSRGNGFPLDQRSHSTIKWLPATSPDYFHSCDLLYISAGN